MASFRKICRENRPQWSYSISLYLLSLFRSLSLSFALSLFANCFCYARAVGPSKFQISIDFAFVQFRKIWRRWNNLISVAQCKHRCKGIGDSNILSNAFFYLWERETAFRRRNRRWKEINWQTKKIIWIIVKVDTVNLPFLVLFKKVK